MGVAVTSDTHGRLNWVMPSCDVFVHAGDVTGRGSIEETSRFAARIRDEMSSPHGPKYAIIVPGNHDQCFELFTTPARELFGANVHVLVDEAVSLDGVRFYGSPWTPPFMRWHFMADETRLASLYAGMPDTLDMLITHGPPRGILDPGWQDAHVGSTALAMQSPLEPSRITCSDTCTMRAGNQFREAPRPSTTLQPATNNTCS